MTKGFIGRIGRAAAIMGAASRASSAVEGGRRPRSADLDALGIDRDSFPRVR